MREGGREGRTDGRPKGGGTAFRGTSKSAVSCGRRRGEGGERLDRRKKEEEEEEEEGGREGRTDGRTTEARRYGALSNQLWVVGGGAGREENDQTEERGRRRRGEGGTDGRQNSGGKALRCSFESVVSYGRSLNNRDRIAPSRQRPQKRNTMIRRASASW